MRTLVAGWFSFSNGHATAGDLLTRDLACEWLTAAGRAYDVALASPFPGGVDLVTVDPSSYSDLVFVCGPFKPGPLEAKVLSRFGHCRLIGLNLTMEVPLEKWNPFDHLIERDSTRGANPDMAFLSRRPLLPVVGICRVESHAGALVAESNAAIDELKASVEMTFVEIDTRLDINTTGQRTPSEIESLIARMDAMVTTRLHGTVLALKNGVPVVAIDPIAGGAKIRRQAELIDWPVIFNADDLKLDALRRGLEFCLSKAGQSRAREAAMRGAARVEEIRSEFIELVNHPEQLEKHLHARLEAPQELEWMRPLLPPHEWPPLCLRLASQRLVQSLPPSSIGSGISTETPAERSTEKSRGLEAAAPEIAVSVLLMTYNHAKFIRQSLDSALMQRMKSRFEILISEDCSTDGTREIVIEYQRRYPQVIRLLLSERNIRSNAVVTRGIEAAHGRYIALLDGDDYWLDPWKLQKQAEFLDRHPECALCFHNARVQHEDKAKAPRNWTPPNHPEFSTLEQLWMGNFIATCSTMFRRGLISKVPEWYEGFFPITDWPLHILNAEHGKIGYLNEVMGVYRHHSGGYYSPMTQKEKLAATLRFYRRMNECLNGKYDLLAKTAISKYFIEWVEEYLDQGNVEAARECFRSYLTGRPINRYITAKRLVRNAARIYLPKSLLPSRWRLPRRTPSKAQQLEPGRA